MSVFFYYFVIFITILSNISCLNNTCHNDTDCNNGKCNNSTSCICNEWFLSYNNIPCNYKQKSAQTAFYLAFFLGLLGAHWFYLSENNYLYIILGILKLIFFMFPIYTKLIVIKFKISIKSKIIIYSLFTLINFIWWITDHTLISTLQLRDGNKQELFDDKCKNCSISKYY